MRALGARGGATLPDGLIFLATVGLAGALLYPAWSAREFRSRVSSAVADVEALSDAARRTLDSDGRWPTAAAPGEAPPELIGLSSEGNVFSRTAYRLGWTSWRVVDSIEAPPDGGPAPLDALADSVGPRYLPLVRSVGGVAVYSSEVSLLAELQARHSGDVSLVLDTMWLLVLPERGTPPPEGP